MSFFHHIPGRGAGSRRRYPASACVSAGVLLLSGCAAPAATNPDASPTPRAALAQAAELAAANVTEADASGSDRGTRKRKKGAAAGRKAADRSARGGRPSKGGRPGGHGPAVRSQDWQEVVTVGDDTADHGDGPSYADLTSLAIHESGEWVRITLDVGGVIPGRLKRSEVEGVGVDVYRSSSRESDYQVFLDGGTSGWRAFLQTPDGFVRFPGSCNVDRGTLTVTVPWESIGGRKDAEVSAFADWSSGVGGLSADGTKPLKLAFE